MSRFDIEKIKENIEVFKASINYPIIEMKYNPNVLLNNVIDATWLRSQTLVDLHEYRLQLAGYNLSLQIEENKLNSYINWCESNIKFIVGKNLGNTEGYGFNEKNASIRSGEPSIIDLEEKKIQAQIKLDLIKNLTFKVMALIEILESYCYEKRSMHKI